MCALRCRRRPGTPDGPTRPARGGGTRAALTDGSQAARRAALGIACGLLVWGTLTVVGLAALSAASTVAYAAVKSECAAYLIALGLVTLWRARRPAPTTEVSPAARPAGHPWRIGFTSNVLIPKIAVFYRGLLPQLVPAHATHGLTLSALVLVHVVLALLWLTRRRDRLRRCRGNHGAAGARQGMTRHRGWRAAAPGAQKPSLATQSIRSTTVSLCHWFASSTPRFTASSGPERASTDGRSTRRTARWR